MTAAKTRVLWLAKGLGRGGAEQLLVQALRHIDRERYDVEVAYVLSWKDALVCEIEAEGIVVHCLGLHRGWRIGWIVALFRLLRRGHFDVVHTHMPSPAAVARVLLLGQRTTVLVHTEHNVWERYRLLTYWANLITYSCNRSVIAVSESVAKSIRRPGPLSRAPMPAVGVIVHGIDIDLMHPCQERRKAARATLGLDDAHMVVGTVGNFTAKKDQKVLLRAAAAMVARIPNLRVVLIGTGPLEESLRQLSEHLGVGDHVLFAGSRGDVPELLPAFDVFTLTSRFEGLSIALLEAMATGLPCVATRVGGVPEIVVDEETGILVPAGDVAAVAHALERLLADPVERLRMGDAARARARALDARSAVRQIENVYDAAVMR